jgi:predicted HTH domain antitoxin
VNTLLAARPDLREALACQLYARGVFSLGRAAEWGGLNIEAFKMALHRRGIKRAAFESPDEIRAMAHQTLRVAGRNQP